YPGAGQGRWGSPIRRSRRASRLFLLRRVGPDADVAEGDRAMVRLQEQRAGGNLLLLPGMARRGLDLLVLVDHFAVENDLHEAGVGRLLAGLVKARRLEGDVERLPLASRFAGVDPGSDPLVDVVVFRLQLGPRVDAATVGAGQFLLAVTVEDLNF